MEPLFIISPLLLTGDRGAGLTPPFRDEHGRAHEARAAEEQAHDRMFGEAALIVVGARASAAPHLLLARPRVPAGPRDRAAAVHEVRWLPRARRARLR